MSTEKRKLLENDGVGAARDGGDRSGSQGNIAAVRQQLDEVRGIMVDNIGRVLKRGEDIDRINTRAAELLDTSEAFAVVARRVKRRMFWRRVKQFAIAGGMAVAIIAVVVLVVAL